MTTDTLNHACSLKEEIDRLNELIERVKDKYFVRISFSRYTGVITNEDIEAVRANLTELIRLVPQFVWHNYKRNSITSKQHQQ